MICAPPHPQNEVGYIWNRKCGACGFVHREESSTGFFTPEAAMDQALFVLRHSPEYVLLYVSIKLGGPDETDTSNS
jgi:hypothetical protein